MGGGRLREVVVHRGLTLCFIRSTFTGTLNHSSIVLNTQIAKKIVISDKFEQDPVFSSRVVLIHDVSGHEHNKLFILVCNSHNVCQSVRKFPSFSSFWVYV